MKYIIRALIWSFLIVIITLAGLLIYLMTGHVEPAKEFTFGITFSQLFAQDMGLNWRATYLAILNDLGVRKLRLVAYWPLIEPREGEYSFDDLDWQIYQANKKRAEVILAVGQKLPRWPECHIPGWAKDLDEREQQKRILLMLSEIVKHYQDDNTIVAWQVENEPFLRGFGRCPKLDKEFLDKEIALIRNLDKKARPIIVTASGELSSWIVPAIRADILGTTLYRIVWDRRLGYVEYPIPPVFYHKRANLVKWLTDVERVIIVELQAEPWGPKLLFETDIEEQALSMDLDKFREIIDYTYQTGFDEAYLWGVEWWYWMKELHKNDSFWQEAKKLWIN